MSERRQEFEHDLEAIEAKVIELFALVAEDLPRATQALLTGNNEVLQVLLDREQVIDALYPEIEELVNREILLQAPVASDLRFLLSVLRIVPELERSHDLMVQIASRSNHILGEDLSPRTRGIVERMGNLASEMWRHAVDSWYQRDRSAAPALEARDDEMDELHASLIAELASGRMALPVTMEMTLVARFYQRLADHAFNYDVHGRRGFELLAQVATASDCFEFQYSALDEAVDPAHLQTHARLIAPGALVPLEEAREEALLQQPAVIRVEMRPMLQPVQFKPFLP